MLRSSSLLTRLEYIHPTGHETVSLSLPHWSPLAKVNNRKGKAIMPCYNGTFSKDWYKEKNQNKQVNKHAELGSHDQPCILYYFFLIYVLHCTFKKHPLMICYMNFSYFFINKNNIVAHIIRATEMCQAKSGTREIKTEMVFW